MMQTGVSEQFLDRLKREVAKPLFVKINNNRQTLLSVKWEPSATKVSMHKIEHAGKVYDLKAIYDKLNALYFKNSLALHITWFGNPFVKNRVRCTLGLYYDSLKLVKIHRRLDDDAVPAFVVEFVVFHEMAHAVCPAFIDERGMHRSHGAEFKRIEKSFWAYKEAESWIKKHQVNFFETRV